jgi:hypothetical protein
MQVASAGVGGDCCTVVGKMGLYFTPRSPSHPHMPYNKPLRQVLPEAGRRGLVWQTNSLLFLCLWGWRKPINAATVLILKDSK